MGDELKSKQNEQFVHGRDRAKKELNQVDLLTLRPELVATSFSCKPAILTILPVPGTTVLIAETEGHLVAIASGEKIGVVSESVAPQLRELMRASPDFQNMLLATVYETADFLGEFTIRVSTEGPKT